MVCICLIFIENREVVTHGVRILSKFRNHQFTAMLEKFAAVFQSSLGKFERVQTCNKKMSDSLDRGAVRVSGLY